MRSRPAPASVTRLVPLAWLMARAFSRTRFLAVLAFPTALLSLVPYQARRALHESADGDGMVILARHRPVVDVLLALPLAMLVAFAGVFTVAVGFSLGGVFVWGVVLLLLLLGVGGGQLMSVASLHSQTGRETPAGDRWSVMALAQRPGTRFSALQMTRDLIATLPTGAVVIAVAGSEALAQGYERLGFRRGKGPRVHLVRD